jgi:putative ABC transport system permease protein
MKLTHNIKHFFHIVFYNKRHYLINIGALSISIAAFAIIASYIFSQQDYDSFHVKKERIFRLINVRHYPSKVDKSAGCIEIAGQEMKSTFPEVEEFAHCIQREQIIRVNEQDFKEPNIYYTTPSFFKIFSFPIIKGGKEENISAPNTCLISEKIAKKYFGDKDPIGKQLNFIYANPVTIEGVIKSPPFNSYFNFDILVSYSTIINQGYCETCNNKNTFILLKDADCQDKLSAKFPEFIKRIHPYDDFRREYLLQPLQEMSSTTDYRFEIGKTRNGEILIYLGLIALLIIIISWLNYISLNTIISFKRLKEYGMRSVSGAKSKTIFWQIVTDSILTTLIATILGLSIAWIVLPQFYNLFNIEYFIIHKKVIFILVGLAVAGAFVIAIFPFLVYMRIKSTGVNNLFKFQKSHSETSRKAFIVVQNIIAIVLIAFSFSTYVQYKFMTDYELGFNSDNLLVVENYLSNSETDLPERVFVENLLKHPGIENVGFSSYIPGDDNNDVGGGFRMEGQKADDNIQLYEEAVSGNFFDLMKVRIVEGEGFAIDNEANSIFADVLSRTRILLNDAAVKLLGFDDNSSIIGKTIIREDAVLGTVVGVVNNYHQKALDSPISPAFFQNRNRVFNFLIKIKPGITAETLDIIKQEYKALSPSGIFNYYFLKDQLQKQYVSYADFLQVIFLFTLLSLIISSIGVYSLSRFIIMMRIKEIGIRKINGATLFEIVWMLNKDFLKWVMLAFVLATPIAYYAMNTWLEGFAYKTQLSWWIFALAGIMALLIALVTISFQTFKVARRNPVEALRYE